ncbi:kinetochore-associated protein NSL1 homolog isoform X1 [Nothobranchius furzeri]|uniref:NSL1 component of MIS12 kinetochore complex n=1 Tax=Nothobranchius furzeri TaxID=105023 RepID=A0A1A8V3J8_NOTFU|nr:transcript variant X1 [Nothobranchius furzeri]
MASEQGETSSGKKATKEHRVHVTSKKYVSELINGYKEVLRAALDGQTDVLEETKRSLVNELLDNFEAAVQLNVLVNGQTWEEAPDAEAEDEAVDLESILDDTIVETTRKRRTYPKKILPHVVQGLKTERKIMGFYELPIKPADIKFPDPESIMSDLSAAAPGVVKQAIQVIKSIKVLQKQTEGLCEVLSSKPSPASMEIHREVLGPNSQSNAPPAANGIAGFMLPVKRAVEETASAEGYVPPAKKPGRRVGDDEPE